MSWLVVFAQTCWDVHIPLAEGTLKRSPKHLHCAASHLLPAIISSSCPHHSPPGLSVLPHRLCISPKPYALVVPTTWNSLSPHIYVAYFLLPLLLVTISAFRSLFLRSLAIVPDLSFLLLTKTSPQLHKEDSQQTLSLAHTQLFNLCFLMPQCW